MILIPSNTRRAVKHFLMRHRIVQALNRFAPSGAVVLMYHSVQHAPEKFEHTIGGGIIHSSAAFDRQMEMIASEFAPVTMDDVHRFLSGGSPLPRRAVAVTFDDGFRDNYEIAAPILAKHGVSATIYVTADCVDKQRSPWFCRIRQAFCAASAQEWPDPATGKPWSLIDETSRVDAMLAAMRSCSVLTGAAQEDLVASIQEDLGIPAECPADHLMLDWTQVGELEREGHLVGSHTMSHPNTARITHDQARQELQRSKQLLDQHLHGQVAHFSYPCAIWPPHWNDHTEILAKEAGYSTAATTEVGPARAGQSPHRIPRLAAPVDIEEFRWALEATLLGYRV